MKKMLLIDGNSLLHRAFHALPPLRTSKGVHTNAVYGFLNMLFRKLEEENPDYITVAFDKKGPTFRHTEYVAYKATRARTPDELIGQFDILKEVLRALHIYFIELDGYEADDLLGTLSKKGEEWGIFSIIVTGDKDALQLVSDNTNVMLTKKGISEMEVYDPEMVKKRYNIPPKAVVDLKGLMGDKSDNIPGVPGIGEKTATKLIQEFNTVEEVLKNIDKLKGKVKENLEKYSEQARISKYLATIVRDIDLDINLDDIVYAEPDYDKLIELFRELEFYSLINRIEKPAVTQATVEETTIDVNNVDLLKELYKNALQLKRVVVLADVEGKKGFTEYRINGIYLFIKDKSYFIKAKLLDDTEIRTVLKSIFQDPSIFSVTHDGKLMRNILRQFDIDFSCNFDTLLAAYILDPSKSNYDIPTLVMEFLGSSVTDQSDIGEKASYLFDLKEAMDDRIDLYDMKDLFYNVEVPFSTVLADMESTGIKVNQQKLKELSDRFGEKLTKLTDEIYLQSGTEFNINSPKQLGEILFERLSLPVIKRTKTGYSTGADVLEKLKPQHPIIENILEYRFLMKLKSTYADGLLSLVNSKTERIYTSFNQTVTSTGRISSTEPNLQNIPVKTEEGKHVRGVFTADGPGHVLLSGDYSQIELRVLAHISQDQTLIDAFINEEDIHTRTASEVFGVRPEEVTPTLRDRAKAVNFGIVYGISDYGLAQSLNISNKEAQDYIDAYFERYPGVRNYVRESIKSAKLTGYVTTLLNRRRYIPDINSRNYHLRSFAERTAMNTPIQGSAADIIKVAMVKVHEYLKENNMKSKILLQVHDEIILDVVEDELSIVKNILKEYMEKAIQLRVPLVVDLKQGYTWEEL
ncbi:MAG TPA: DNA polymerase I [Thermoanaerobacterales bacterium]|nr:DNA polymerase I [Thermoanaerobacterales bacterium]